MGLDISGFGVGVTIVADVSFPTGIEIKQFADDADALDFASIKIGDVAMGLNGDLLSWSKANPLPLTLNVVPNSQNDRDLGILAENNRAGKGKIAIHDTITLVVIYPDTSTITFIGGKITDAMFGQSISSAGRMKSKPYIFNFENKVEAPAV